jgi:hypothetical protein
MAGGNTGFNAGLLAKTLVKADRLWAEKSGEYTANVDCINAVRNEQSVKIKELSDPEKDREVTIYWLDDCGQEAQDCTDSCDFDGAPVLAKEKTYALTQCKEVKFSESIEKYRTAEFSLEETLAHRMNSSMASLDNAIAQGCAAFIDSASGVNAVLNGDGQVIGTDTFINPAKWNMKLMAYFQQVAIMNKFKNPFLMTGSNLSAELLYAVANAGNSNGSGDLALSKMFRKYVDMWNIDSINNPVQKTYLLDKNAIVFASKARYSATPMQYATQMRFSVESKNLKGVFYDVIQKERCVNNDIYYDFKLTARFDFFTQPGACDAGTTGVLSFTNGCPPI